MTHAEELRHQIQHSPDLPGVYIFRDAMGEVLYVGKALSLRKRLSSYLAALEGGEGKLPVKVEEMVQRASAVEWVVTANETEAFLLEHNLIKQHRPPFNIRLRDDKSYPYIVVTLEDEYPRVMFTRQPHRKGNLYFGPYSNAAKVRETLDALVRVFPLRSCRGKTPGRRSGSPCLQYHIRRCPGPCIGAVSPEIYRTTVQQVVDFLMGREKGLLEKLEREMKEAAAKQEFEAAALLRDRVEALRHVLEYQKVESSALGSADIIGIAVDDWGANVQVFITRDGRVADRRSFTFVNAGGVGTDEIFERFLYEYYGSVPAVPAQVIVPRSVRDTKRIEAFLQGLRGAKVEVRTAERGDKRRLLELAEHNASLSLTYERIREQKSREKRREALETLQEVLRLPRLPLRIEGFDVSNLGEEHIVASMAVFEAGAPNKSHYRRFIIRETHGQDDVGAIYEAVFRRFSHGQESVEATKREYDPSFEAVPELVLIDGGKGQLNAALAALDSLDLRQSVSAVALAKREEELYVPWSSVPLRLPRDHPGLLLLQRVRDEAHRFAVSFHRGRRAMATTASLFDQLPGVGEKRKQAIIRHFGSPERFLSASREELEAVPGLPGKVAREIYAYLHKTG
ncbi:MAG: excinuclease ABC subunit UvrC [Thermoleophilia bacterium]|nr:excinuclease ABC subunit UvrC [Thermoleophilia bacterium]